ncbi:Usp17le, partial [Symbiodinium necroappetens]
AFRGPQDGVRRTALVAQAISHAVGGSTRMLGRGIGVVVTSFAGAVFQKAAAGAHVLVAVVNPCHRMLQHAVFQAFSGIGQAAKWLADAADAAAQSPSATAKAVPESRVTQEAHGSFMEQLRGGKVLRISRRGIQ